MSLIPSYPCAWITVNSDWNAIAGPTLIRNKPTAQAHISDSSANAATNAPTNLNTVSTVLGTLVGEVNATNTKLNDVSTKYNDLSTKFNTLLSHLETQGLQLTS